MWFDHVLGWWKHKDDPNILILKYEEMKKVRIDRINTASVVFHSTALIRTIVLSL